MVGLKPTYGRVSRYGLIAYASSLDVVGPVAPSVMDAAVLLTAMAGALGNCSIRTCIQILTVQSEGHSHAKHLSFFAKQSVFC